MLRILPRWSLIALLFFALFPPRILGGVENATQIEALADAGLSVMKGTIMPPAEVELRKLMAEEKKLRREVDLAWKQWATVQQQDLENQALKKELLSQHRMINANLAQARSVRENNQWVAAIKEIEHQIKEVESNQEFAQKVDTARGGYAEAREKYVELVLAARKAADLAGEQWQAVMHDEAAKGAVQAYAKTAGKEVALGPSKSYAALLKGLAKLEKSVLSEEIELRRDGGNTFEVDAVLNGKQVLSMVVDSGASLVCLPYAEAQRAGIEAPQDAERLTLQIADGSIVQASRVRIPSVRVGKFSVENVDAAILPPQLSSAPALLGMSFLGQFEFRLDSDAGKLSLTKLETPQSGKARNDGKGGRSEKENPRTTPSLQKNKRLQTEGTKQKRGANNGEKSMLDVKNDE